MLQQHFNYYAQSIQVYVHQLVIIITFKNTHHLISILHIYSFTLNNSLFGEARNWKEKRRKNCREHNNGSARKIVVILIKTIIYIYENVNDSQNIIIILNIFSILLFLLLTNSLIFKCL